MKTLFFILFLSLNISMAIAQGQVKNAKKRTAKSTPSRGAVAPKNASAPFVSNSVDSFKRSLRYSPGRPYEVKNNDTLSKGAIAKSNAGTMATATNTTGRNSAVMNGNTAINQTNAGATVVNPPIRNVPVSPSMERNLADVNQRPVNENSKNAVDGMNASQVNTLNNNQMAPPPENWGFTPADNWGRNTVGSSQWSPADKVSSSFNREFPEAGESTWYNDPRDSASTMVQYKTNNNWAAALYNKDGVRTETRVQIAKNQTPDPVLFYMNSQNNKYPIRQVFKISRPGKEDVFRVVLNTGRQVYINNQGAEIVY